MPLDYNPNAALADWVAKNKVEKPAVKVPIEETSNSVTPTEESDKPKAEEAPKEQPKEEKPTEESVKTTQQETPKSWDADETATGKTETPTIDFSNLGSALELGEVKSQEEFVSKVSELKSKLKEYQEKPLTGIPDEFKEVIEVTKSGVDWKDYLANQLIDYSKVDPVQLFEEAFLQDAVKDPRFQTEGKYDPQKAEDALDALPESLRMMYGKQIAQGRIQEQRQRQLQLKAQAEAKLAQAEQSLTSATKNLNELLPFENYGIKFEPKHSTEIYQGITNSKLTKKLLGVNYEDLVKSGADMKAVARTIAAAEYAEKMIRYKSQSAKVEGKKELLDKIQNPQIKSTGSSVQPESEGKKVLTPAQKLELYMSNINKSGLK
jgi:hypothetical protein